MIDKEAGIGSGLKALGRGVASVAPSVLGATAAGGAFLGANALGVPTLGRYALMGLGGSLGGALGGAINKKVNQPAGPQIPPYLLHAMAAAHQQGQGQGLRKAAAKKDNSYYQGVDHAEKAFQALDSFGLEPGQLKRVHNILKRSPGVKARMTELDPNGARNFRRGTTKAFKQFLQAAKDAKKFRGMGYPEGSAAIDHESGKIRYTLPGQEQHFAVRRPGAMWGSNLEMYGMPKAASVSEAFMHTFQGLLKSAAGIGSQESKGSGGMPHASLRRRLEEHAAEHEMMKRMGIGHRGLAASASSLLRR